MSVGPETLRLHAERLTTLSDIVDDATRQTVRGWVRAWDQIAQDLDAALEVAAARIETGQRLTWRHVNDVERFSAAMSRAAAELDDLAAAGRVAVRNAAGETVQVAQEFNPRIIASQFPATGPTTAELAGLFSGRMSGDALEQIVARTEQTIASRFRPLSADALASMRRELVRGVTVGDNPRRAASQMLSRLEGRFNGGLTRALNIARTEMLDAYRAGSTHVSEANSDVLSHREWHASLDDRTCPACWAMHGETFPLNQFGPEGHQQCRCTFVEVTKSWRDLGFDVDEPPSMTPDAREVFAGMDREQQLRVMGPGRLQALEDGRVGWGDLAQRRANDGWRDGFYATPLRDLGVEPAMAGAGA